MIYNCMSKFGYQKDLCFNVEVFKKFEMLCRLCLLECEDLLEIFDEQGEKLNISSIVEQHFGIELRSDDLSSKICTTCWLEIENFHVFYVDIQRAQEKLKINSKNVNNELEVTESENVILKENESHEVPQLEGYSISPNDILAIDRDLSNVLGDIDIFAAPSTTGESSILNNLDISECTNIDDNLQNMTECTAMDFCTVDYNEDLNADEEYINTSSNGYGIPDLAKILQRKEISIIPMPDVVADVAKENNDKIKKYIQLNCEVCSAQFDVFSDLKKHFQEHHNISGYAVCCNEKLYKRGQILEHIRKHINSNISSRFGKERNFCPKKANTETSFIKICQICRKVYRNRKLFENHMWEHQIGRTNRVQCKQCGLYFKSKHSLQKHIRLHIDQNNDHVCALCGKKSMSDVSLHRHMKNVHYKERKYQCSLCDKAFKWSINLKEHMAIHTGERLYTCPYCPKTFNASSNLHSHRKKVHRLEWEEERRKRLETAINVNNI